MAVMFNVEAIPIIYYKFTWVKFFLTFISAPYVTPLIAWNTYYFHPSFF
jgi:hypothetical protein